MQDIFRYLPVPDVQQEFNLTSEFIKEVMDNDKEPPPYFFIRRSILSFQHDLLSSLGIDCLGQCLCLPDAFPLTLSLSVLFATVVLKM